MTYHRYTHQRRVGRGGERRLQALRSYRSHGQALPEGGPDRLTGGSPPGAHPGAGVRFL